MQKSLESWTGICRIILAKKRDFFLHFFCTTSAERTDEEDPEPAVARRVRASVVNQQPV